MEYFVGIDINDDTYVASYCGKKGQPVYHVVTSSTYHDVPNNEQLSLIDELLEHYNNEIDGCEDILLLSNRCVYYIMKVLYED